MDIIMKKYIFPFLSFTLLFSISHLYAQELYMPRNVKQAYVKQTRSVDGSVGKNYWQNHGEYKINISVAPPDRTIIGSETIKYYNNSPDSIRNLTIKLFQNIHKSIAPRDVEIDTTFITNGIIIDSIYVNNQIFDIGKESLSFTNFAIRLSKPLAPENSVYLAFKWHYKIAKQGTKEGMVDSTTFFLGLFYPRVAVFDDYSGWDRIPYTGIREFYSDYNDYDVTINVPKNFLVWGTGLLQHPENLLRPEILKKYQLATQSNQVIHVVTQQELHAQNITADNKVNSWRFITKNIPDVAYGISDHYVWDATSVSGRTMINIAYNDTTKEYHHLARFSQHAVKWFSNNFPGTTYPYPRLNVFQTFEEMEYPMMVKGSAYGDTTFAKFVVEHEIAHNYFPFFVGTNETRYGFMDEGWITTFELLIGIADRGKKEAEEFYKQIRVLGWKYNQSAGEDMPIINPTDNVIGDALGDNEYGKPSLGFLALKDMLGDSLFKKSLHSFINQWEGKHPLPWDMFYTFNIAAGEDLNWFWNNWFFNNHYIDLKLEQVKQSKNSCEITIGNIGGIFTPLDIVITYQDGTEEKYHKTPKIWKAYLKKVTIKLGTKKKIKSVQIDGGIFMDVNTSDNKMVL